MIAIGHLINHENYRLRMIAVHHAWAMIYQRNSDHSTAAVQFHAARELLDEVRERRCFEAVARTYNAG